MNRKTKVVKVFEKGQRGNSVKNGAKENRQQTADSRHFAFRHQTQIKNKIQKKVRIGANVRECLTKCVCVH